MAVFRRLISGIDAFLKFSIAILTLVLLAMLFIQVLNRYVFSLSWPALQFIIPLCFAWLTMLGSALGIRRKLHFEIDLFSSKLGQAGRRAYATLMFCAVVLGGAIMASTGFDLARLGAIKSHPATGLPFVYIYASILIGGLLISLLAIEQMVKQFSSKEPSRDCTHT